MLHAIRKWAVALGLILLIVASVMLTSYRNVYATPVLTQSGANPDQYSKQTIGGWTRTGSFLKGDVIMVELLWNIFWAQLGGFDTVQINETYWAVLYVNVTITDPTSAMSSYQLWLTYDASANQFSYLNASAISIGAGISPSVYLPNGFNFTYTFIAGTANYNGTYFANVTSVVGTAPDYREYEDGTYSPAAFQLFYARTSFTISKPYGNLLYVGIAFIPISIAFLAYCVIGNRTKRKAPLKQHLNQRPKNSPNVKGKADQ